MNELNLSKPAKLVVIIPVLNEEKSIGKVIGDIPEEYKKFVVVVDNGSKDQTASVAKKYGAHVVYEPLKGYGAACLRGVKLAKTFDPEFFVFLDGDYSDEPSEMLSLLNEIESKQLDLVIGSRVRGQREKGALLPQARFGNWLTTRLIKWTYGFEFTDLGPFRIIRRSAYESLAMEDLNFGWTIEMQMKALKYKLKVGEIPVSYKKRIGQSKISGTLKGSVMAGIIILKTFFKYLKK